MLPLEGIKVVDLTHWILGPSCSATLGDWGAEVLKIEDPETGDDLRWFLTAVDIDESDSPVSLFGLDNRNTRGMAIDLNRPEGQDIVHKLVEDADIFVSNMRRKVLERWQMDHGRLMEINPRLIYAHSSGFGDKGPDVDKPGFDATAYWARSGLMAGIALQGQPPVSQQYPGVGDHVGALGLFGGVMLALYNREKTGQGQQVDLSLLGVGTWATSCPIQFVLSMGEEPPRWPREEIRNAMINFYRARDDRWLYIACLPDEPYWIPLCEALDRQDLIQDPRFRTRDDRLENSVALISILDEIFATRTRDEWGQLLDEYGIIWTHVPMSFKEVANDPQVLASDHIVEAEHPEYGPTKIITSPIRLNKQVPPIRMFAPEIGQHNEEILLERGYSWEEIEELKDKGVIP